MRFKEYINQTPEQLEEISLKHAIVGAAAIASMAGGMKHATAPDAPIHPVKHTLAKQKSVDELVKDVVTNYRISTAEAKLIVTTAKKYETETFKVKDILAIIGIESSFNVNAKSNLKHDKAVGLMQVRPLVWGLKKGELNGNIDKQIKMGVNVLDKYHKRLKNKDDTIHAFNIGMKNFLNGKLNPKYVASYKNELKKYS